MNSNFFLILPFLIAPFLFLSSCALVSKNNGDRGPASEDLSQEVQEVTERIENEDEFLIRENLIDEARVTKARPFRAPKYSGQEGRLGYDSNIFEVPKGLEKQVEFWKKVYSQWDTDEGVIHDSEDVTIVYEIVSFKDISIRKDLNLTRKERLKAQRVKEVKKHYQSVLQNLAKKTTFEDLSEDEKKVFDLFQGSTEAERFKAAAQDSRMRFQLGQRDRFLQAIYFSGRYLEEFEKTFEEFNLPIELTRLVFVESSFNVLARSKVGASGLWQIMPKTMRAYSRKSSAVDMRNHPGEATKVAAKILKSNFQMLREWPLAITGYNHGPTGVKKMVDNYKTTDISELVANVKSRKSFGFASRNFYACFLAALEVERKAPEYFGKVQWSASLNEKSLKSAVGLKYDDLKRWFGGNEIQTQVYNPHLTKEVRSGKIPIPSGTLLYVPQERYEVAFQESRSLEALANARKKGMVAGDKERTADQPND